MGGEKHCNITMLPWWPHEQLLTWLLNELFICPNILLHLGTKGTNWQWEFCLVYKMRGNVALFLLIDSSPVHKVPERLHPPFTPDSQIINRQGTVWGQAEPVIDCCNKPVVQHPACNQQFTIQVTAQESTWVQSCSISHMASGIHQPQVIAMRVCIVLERWISE